jgi:hypothetical protein
VHSGQENNHSASFSKGVMMKKRMLENTYFTIDLFENQAEKKYQVKNKFKKII